MSTRIVINGTQAEAVYDDRFRPLLEALGAMKVERASEVEFDAATGEWVAVHIQSGTEIARDHNRQAAIAAEVAWLEQRRIK